MNAAQLRSLPVQVGLMAGLFLGCLVLGAIIVSQRWRFESFVKESYAAPRQELSEPTRSVTKALLRGEAAGELWKRVPDSERRAVYNALMQGGESPTAYAAACLETDEAFFMTAAERTVVCGDSEQRSRGLKFLELSGADRAGRVFDRLTDWAKRWNRPDDLAAIGEARNRMQRASNDFSQKKGSDP